MFCASATASQFSRDKQSARNSYGRRYVNDRSMCSKHIWWIQSIKAKNVNAMFLLLLRLSLAVIIVFFYFDTKVTCTYFVRQHKRTTESYYYILLWINRRWTSPQPFSSIIITFRMLYTYIFGFPAWQKCRMYPRHTAPSQIHIQMCSFSVALCQIQLGKPSAGLLAHTYIT